MITKNLGAIPKLIYSPIIISHLIPVNSEKNIFVIEIERKEDCVYYSKKDSVVYIRRNDESHRLDPPEALDLVFKKSSSKVVVGVNKTTHTYSNRIELEWGYMNKGNSPAIDVTSIIKIISNNPKQEILFEGRTKVDLSHLHPLFTQVYEVSVGFKEDIQAPLYPNVGVLWGKLIISPRENANLLIDIENYDRQGVTKHQLKIKTDTIGNLQIETTEPEHSTYFLTNQN